MTITETELEQLAESMGITVEDDHRKSLRPGDLGGYIHHRQAMHPSPRVSPRHQRRYSHRQPPLRFQSGTRSRPISSRPSHFSRRIRRSGSDSYLETLNTSLAGGHERETTQ